MDFQIQVKALLENTQIQEQLTALQNKLQPLKINIDTSAASGLKSEKDGIDSLVQSTDKYTSSIEGMRLAREKITQGGITQTFKSESDAVDKTVTSTKNGTTELNNYDSAQKRVIANESGFNTLKIKVSGLTEAQKQLTSATERMAAIEAQTDPVKRAAQIRSLSSDINAASRNMNTFAASVEYTVERFVQIGLVVGTFRLIKNAISDMIGVVTDLNTSLVELQKVTDLEGNSLKEFVNQAYAVGKSVGRTGQEVVDATTIFARSGYDIQDALDLADTALVLLNVGDGISSVSEAATSLISVLKGYNLEASKAMEITDLINQVSNTSAINFADLTEGLTRTSAVFNQAGVSIGQLTGLLTGAQEVLQNVEKVSSGLITISQRWIYYLLVIYLGAYVQKCA